jgi:DnaD/phage-associated family protein
MARKRMFDIEIIDTDLFLDMPTSTRLLYYDLGMRADDDGFINNYKKIMKMTGTSDDDLKILFSKQYLIPFDTGVIVVKHWKINNYLRKDRYTETLYKEEKKQLKEDENGAYLLSMPKVGIPVVDTVKKSIEENSKEENRTTTTIDINIYETLESNFGRTISPMEFEKINEWLLLFNKDILIYGIELCVLQNKKTFAYLEGILKNWKSQQYKTLEEIKENEISKTEKPKERTYL